MNQTENGEGYQDPEGKWLADYTLYVEYFEKASFAGPEAGVSVVGSLKKRARKEVKNLRHF